MCKIIFLGYRYDSVVGMADSIGSVPRPVASQPARRLCLTAAQAEIDWQTEMHAQADLASRQPRTLISK